MKGEELGVFGRARRNAPPKNRQQKRTEAAPSEKSMNSGSAGGSVAGGNAVASDFWSWSGASRADGKQLSSEKREGISGGAAQEGAAGKDSVGEIDMAFVFGGALRYVHRPGGRLGKIEDKKAGEDFLEDEIRLFSVEMDEANGIFQAAEGGLNAPAPGVEGFERREWEQAGIQIGDKDLHLAAAGL